MTLDITLATTFMFWFLYFHKRFDWEFVEIVTMCL